MRLVTFLTVLITAATLLLPGSLASPRALDVDLISSQPHQGNSIVQFLTNVDGFDGPKIKNLNSTVFDLWYFDVISQDLQSSAVVVFFTATTEGLFPGLPDLDTAVWALIEVTYPGGSFETIIQGDQMQVTTTGNAVKGLLTDRSDSATASWQSSSDMSTHTVNILAPELGVTGTVKLISAAPAHFPCSACSARSGQSLQLAPNLGWFNAVPDAAGTVSLRLDGKPVTFSGPGYHDKNWGSRPWHTTLRSWYWGHARVGPYSVVWFDHIDADGKEGASGYVSQNNKILAATCSGTRVRPTGRHAVYPPNSQTTLPDGFAISMSVPGHGEFSINLSNQEVIDQTVGLSTRWLGTVQGGFQGSQQHGIALYEQFTFV